MGGQVERDLVLIDIFWSAEGVKVSVRMPSVS